MGANNTLADRLKRARSVADISARELAGLAGISATHVSLIEGGKQIRAERVTARTVERLARVLGVSLDWLIAGRGKEPAAAEIRAAVARARRAVQRTGTEG